MILTLPGPLLQTVVPGHTDFVELVGDLEWEVYRILVSLSCAPFLPSYVKVSFSKRY